MKLKFFTLGFIILFSTHGIFGQENSNASGNTITGTGGSVSYTVGQIFYQMQTGTNGSLNHGVQQPYEISVVSVFEAGSGITLDCSVFPNPVVDQLYLTIGDVNVENLFYFLFDINGKCILQSKIIENINSINLHELSASSYYLRICRGSKEIKVFKIVKN